MPQPVRSKRRLELRKTLFLLPNLITLSAIFCGFDSIRIAAAATTPDEFYRAAVLLVFSMVFDALDGRVARMTKTQSAFGLQIDSLADVISFGVAPGVLLHAWTLHRLGTLGLVIAFAYVAAAAVRLARFNVLSMAPSGSPSTPSAYFLGLPTPGAAGVVISLAIANQAVGGALGQAAYTPAFAGLTVVLALLMVSNVEFRTFKNVKLDLRAAAWVALLGATSAAVSARTQPAFVLVWLLGFYVAFGLVESAARLPGRVRERRALREASDRAARDGELAAERAKSQESSGDR